MELKIELVQSTFSHLKAAPESGEMVLKAAEQRQRPKRYIWRRVVITAAILALAMSLTIGVNAATGGQLMEQAKNIAIFLRNGEKGEISVVSDEDGRVWISSRILEAEEGGSGKSSIVYYDADGKRRSIVLEEGEDFPTAP